MRKSEPASAPVEVERNEAAGQLRGFIFIHL